MIYVVSAKNKETGEFDYFGYDKYAGSYSSGYPIFTNYLGHASTHQSAESAAKEFNENKKDIASSDLLKYDLTTLGVRKIVFKKEMTLSITTDTSIKINSKFKIGDWVTAATFFKGKILCVQPDGWYQVEYYTSRTDTCGCIRDFHEDELLLLG